MKTTTLLRITAPLEIRNLDARDSHRGDVSGSDKPLLVKTAFKKKYKKSAHEQKSATTPTPVTDDATLQKKKTKNKNKKKKKSAIEQAVELMDKKVNRCSDRISHSKAKVASMCVTPAAVKTRSLEIRLGSVFDLSHDIKKADTIFCDVKFNPPVNSRCYNPKPLFLTRITRINIYMLYSYYF